MESRQHQPTQRAPPSAKVKLLCSYGGKILPRPTDGLLRYVGGHTRIVSVPKTIPFEELIAKMSEVNGNGGAPVVMKYQLPDEDLDALISVSCSEDLENMMEEYDKVVEADASAAGGKIRVFLFNVDGADAVVGDFNDTGQRYFEAVNGIGISNESGGSSIGSLKRKDSGLSAGSSNSGVEITDNFNDNTVVSPQKINYTGQGYLDPNHLQFYNNPSINLVPLSTNPTQTNNLNPNENYNRVVQPPLSQLPPLPPAYQLAQHVEALDDCHMCQKMLPHSHSDTIVRNHGNGSPGTGSEVNPVFFSQRSEDATRTLVPPPQNLGVDLLNAQHEGEKKPFFQKIVNLDHSRVFIPPVEAQSYEMFLGNFLQAQNLVPSQIPINPQVIAKPMGNDVNSTRNTERSSEFANEYFRTINGMMEGMHLSPRNTHVTPESLHTVVDNAYVYVPQVGSNVMYPSSTQFARPMDQMPPNTSDINQIHNFPTMVENQGPFPHHLGIRVEPPMPSEGLLAIPTYAFNGDKLVNNDLLSGNMIIGLSNATTSPTGLLESFQEPSPTDSLFSNQDPRKFLGGAHHLPPKPKRVPSRELIAPKDSGVIHLGNSTESDIIALLEEGGLHPSTNSQNQPIKGSGDEQVKQDLQAVAEGVASSVLNSSLIHSPVIFAHDTKDTNTEFKHERKISETTLVSPDRKVEDNMPKTGLHITDDICRLQIIKNSDLEELRELGSGTFGTVYHGKWRGSDVAIKRINDRCFAGKPSEQEKMRTDFWNEACKLADLHHPNVVAFYGVVLDGPGGSVATVTEFMVNGSLRNALQRNDRSLDRRKCLLIAMDVAFGMEYLHGKNIVHFDLKSDNLLVNLRDPQRPICKVGDLGLSKVKCQTLISGGVRGTLPWMAPELLNGSSSLVSEKVDVFSFGIVLWELLTGEEPYADLHYGAIIGGIVSNTLRPPTPEYCDPEWKALMEKCWSADPSERPSFTEVAEMLRNMASSLPQKAQK